MQGSGFRVQVSGGAVRDRAPEPGEGARALAEGRLTGLNRGEGASQLLAAHLERGGGWWLGIRVLGGRGTSLIRNSLPQGPPQGPRHNPTVWSYGGAVSYKRGTPVRLLGWGEGSRYRTPPPPVLSGSGVQEPGPWSPVPSRRARPGPGPHRASQTLSVSAARDLTGVPRS